MTRFVIDKPVATVEPAVLVEGDFKPGLHRFRLVVFTEDGRASRPDEAVVRVQAAVIAPPRLPPRRPHIRRRRQ